MPDEAAPDRVCLRCALLKGSLLVLWALVSFVCTFYARDLQFMLVGWPFNYWMAAQGAVLVFIVIVAVYAWGMNRIEALEHGTEAMGRDKGVADV
jgi:putative solute:sodium symporter small subunit